MTVTECNDYGPHDHRKKPGRVPLTMAGNALLRNPPGPFTGPITRADIAEIERQAVERYLASRPSGDEYERGYADGRAERIMDVEGGIPHGGEAQSYAWLVERGQAEGQTPTVWWTGSEWTEDANAALRFPDKTAALAYVAPDRRLGRVVEHVFLATPSSTPDVEGL